MNREKLIEDLKAKSEIIPDSYDGSYELVRETVASYATLDDYSMITYLDLDAVYLMAIGTWKINSENKKKKVNNSCLPAEEKKRLVDLIEEIWDKACLGKYEHTETLFSKGKPSVGMFGTGFMSFKSMTSEKCARDFIEMCVDISKLDSDEEMFDRAEKIFSSNFKGMGAAAASIILHCLKPYSFPILNGNLGNDSVYPGLGIDIEKPASLATYIDNCRKIKSFRDEHFDYRNYRVFDLMARELPNYTSEEPVDSADTVMGKISFDHNTILYGPPGTGKTYNCAIYAVAICDGKSVEDLTDYDAVMTRYEELKLQNRIAFTTFHQSYGYEEFIEGIKPVVDSNSADVSYTIESGIFKKFCENAKIIQEDDIEYTGTVWAVRNRAGDRNVASDFEQSLYEQGVIKIEDITDDNRQCGFLTDMAPGDWVVLGRNYVINAIGVVVDDMPEEIEDGVFHYQRHVKWKVTGINSDCRPINRGRCFPSLAIAQSLIKIQDLQKLVYGDIKNETPYVIIIDEINRGNISKIFGELITLIENTKREGMAEAASAILPYSGEEFSVPSNVFILGTMNTADRSIALMDTALRRRFSFIEMMPDADVLRNIGADKVSQGENELDVALMLEVMNERISFLYDREHTIGHAFFTGLEQDPSVENLAKIFEKSVIPLLQEYFYEDYQKIQLVLGDSGKTDDNFKFIKDAKVVAKNIFKGNIEDVIDLPEKKYEVNKAAFANILSYIEIM